MFHIIIYIILLNISRRSCEKWMYLQTNKHNYPFLDTPPGETRTTSSSFIVFMYQHMDHVGEDEKVMRDAAGDGLA